jgi:hypothetical protein
MTQRTIAQLALLAVGLILWGYGARVDDEWLRWIGIGCFAAAVVLRLFKKREQASSS